VHVLWTATVYNHKFWQAMYGPGGLGFYAISTFFLNLSKLGFFEWLLAFFFLVRSLVVGTYVKPYLQNYPLCIKWDVKLCSLDPSLCTMATEYHHLYCVANHGRSMCKILTGNRACWMTRLCFLDTFIIGKKKGILFLRIKYFELMTCALSPQWIVRHRSSYASHPIFLQMYLKHHVDIAFSRLLPGLLWSPSSGLTLQGPL